MNHLIAFAISFIASFSQVEKQPAPVASLDMGRIATVSPSRQARFTKEHRPQAPFVRYTVTRRSGNRITRTLAGDASGQTVTYTLD